MDFGFEGFEVVEPMAAPPASRVISRDTSIARASALQATKLRSKVKRNQLLAILRSPPGDYDGTNAKLASYLNVSTRTVMRLLKGLEAEGRLLRRQKTFRTGAGFYQRRMISIKKEI